METGSDRVSLHLHILRHVVQTLILVSLPLPHGVVTRKKVGDKLVSFFVHHSSVETQTHE